MRKLLGLVVMLGAVAVGCGGSSSSNNPPPNPDSGTPGGLTISINNNTFSPAELTVDAGAQISVTNNDTASKHSVTCEATDNSYVAGAVAGVSFDTGELAPATPGGTGPYGPTQGSPGGTAVISIPASAPSGTVIPFFDTVQKGSMSPPNGHITVR